MGLYRDPPGLSLPSVRRHFGEGEFKHDETSFDSTAFPPSTIGCSAGGCKYVEFGRAGLYLMRQDPERWPRNETCFEDDVRQGLIDVVEKLSKRVTLFVVNENVQQKAIEFEGSKVIEVFPQGPPIAKDRLNAKEASLFEPWPTDGRGPVLHSEDWISNAVRC